MISKLKNAEYMFILCVPSIMFLVTILFLFQIRYLGLPQQLGMFTMWLLSMLSVVQWKGLTVMILLLFVPVYNKLIFEKGGD